MSFTCIKKENLKAEFIEIVIDGKIVTSKIPVSVPLKIVFTSSSGDLVQECIVSINKKSLKQKKKIYLLEQGGNMNEQ